MADIYSGKIKIEGCNAVTLSKLSKALGITMEELILLETGNNVDAAGKPKKKEYLEIGLPESLQKADQKNNR